jgi:hypothetical protein
MQHVIENSAFFTINKPSVDPYFAKQIIPILNLSKAATAA